MSILHLTPAVSRLGGGVWEYLRDLTRAQAQAGLRPKLLGVRDAFSVQDCKDIAWAPVLAGRRLGPRSLSFSPELGRVLSAEGRRAQVIHAHGGLRMWPNVQARQTARKLRRPFLLSTHGMLYPHLLEKSPGRKRLLGWLFDNANLESADCIHATCMQELEHLRAYGLGNPIAVIPPGVDGPSYDSDLPSLIQDDAAHRTALFLGIMQPKKGLLRLAESWAEATQTARDWHLLIAGPDDYGHRPAVEAALEKSFAATGRSWRAFVTFIGPVYGREKIELLQRCELFILPTDWENFGIVVGEALASARPVITSRTTPWQGLVDHSCGWWIEPTSEALTQTLHQALAMPRLTLKAMGQRGRAWVKAEFDWARVAHKTAELYQWVCGQAPIPAFVHVDG